MDSPQNLRQRRVVTSAMTQRPTPHGLPRSPQRARAPRGWSSQPALLKYHLQSNGDSLYDHVPCSRSDSYRVAVRVSLRLPLMAAEMSGVMMKDGKMR